MSVAHRARLLLRRAGVDVQRFPAESVEFQSMRTLVAAGADLLLDVGAHHGQFVVDSRAAGCMVPAVSFEPGTQAFARLQQRVRRDRHWQAVNAAVDIAEGRAVLHLAGNAGASSSLLAMLPLHSTAARDADYVGSEVTQVVRLDQWLAHNRPAAKRLAVKLDVQGAERAALISLGSRLEDVVWLRVEMSVLPLYEGSWDWLAASGWLTSRGFRLVAVLPGFTNPVDAHMLQFDAVFTR